MTWFVFLLAFCAASHTGAFLLKGRSRKQKVELERAHVLENIIVAGKALEYMQVEGAFSQPNGGMCQQMLNWAHKVTEGSPGDLVELYCGELILSRKNLRLSLDFSLDLYSAWPAVEVIAVCVLP